MDSSRYLDNPGMGLGFGNGQDLMLCQQGEEDDPDDLVWPASGGGMLGGMSNDMGGGGLKVEVDEAFDSMIADSLLEMESGGGSGLGGGLHFLSDDNLFLEEDVDQCMREQEEAERRSSFGIGMMGHLDRDLFREVMDMEDSLLSLTPGPPSISSSLGLGPEAELDSVVRCTECFKSFANPVTLEVHMRLHTGERPYRCEECGEAFIHQSYLEYHTKTLHNGGGTAVGTPKPPEIPSALSFSSNNSGLGSKPDLLGVDWQNLNWRMKKESIGKRETEEAGIDGAVPPKAEMTTIAMEEWEAIKPFTQPPTDTLSKPARKKSSLASEKVKPYECPTCLKGFARMDGLRIHMRVHTGEKPFVCPVCTKAFRQSSCMKRHVKQVHNIDIKIEKKVKGEKNLKKKKKKTGTKTKAEKISEKAYKKFNLRPCLVRLTKCDKNLLKPVEPEETAMTGESSQSGLSKLEAVMGEREEPNAPQEDVKPAPKMQNWDHGQCAFILNNQPKVKIQDHQENESSPGLKTQNLDLSQCDFVLNKQAEGKGKSQDRQEYVEPSVLKIQQNVGFSQSAFILNNQPVLKTVAGQDGEEFILRIEKVESKADLMNLEPKVQQNWDSTNLKMQNVESKAEPMKVEPKIRYHDGDHTYPKIQYPELKPEVMNMETKMYHDGNPASPKFQNVDESKAEPELKIQNVESLAKTIPPRSRPASKQQFQCETCLRIFSRKNYLVEHVRSHTGEKPYECPTCLKRFARQSCYCEHVRTHNFADGKPFKCELCGKGFGRKTYLKNHLDKNCPKNKSGGKAG